MTDSAETVREQALIDGAPEPLKKLGSQLADILDDDHWNNIEPLLLEIAAILSPAPSGEREKLAKYAEQRSKYAFDGVEFVEVNWDSWDEILAALRQPVPVKGLSEEELAVVNSARNADDSEIGSLLVDELLTIIARLAPVSQDSRGGGR